MPAGDHTWLWNNKIVTIWAYRVAKLIRHVMDEQAADNVTVREEIGSMREEMMREITKMGKKW